MYLVDIFHQGVWTPLGGWRDIIDCFEYVDENYTSDARIRFVDVTDNIYNMDNPSKWKYLIYGVNYTEI